RPQLDPPHRATPPGRTASSRHGALFLVRDEGRASARPIDDGPVVPQQIAPDDTVALARTARAAPTAAEARTHVAERVAGQLKGLERAELDALTSANTSDVALRRGASVEQAVPRYHVALE